MISVITVLFLPEQFLGFPDMLNSLDVMDISQIFVCNYFQAEYIIGWNLKNGFTLILGYWKNIKKCYLEHVKN